MCIWIFIYTRSFIFHLPTSGFCAAQTQLKLYEKINQNCNKMQKVQNEDKSACVPVPPLIYTSNEPRQKCQSGQFVKECSVNVRINLLGHNFFAHAKMHPFSTL